MAEAHNVPDWVVVKRLNEVSIPSEQLVFDIDTWPAIAQKRIRNFLQGRQWYPGGSGSSGNYKQMIFEEYAGHGLLRLVAAENSRVMGWLVEQEGDLFQWRFENSQNTQEKLAILRYLFGENKVLDSRALWARFDLHNQYFQKFRLREKWTNTIGVHFSCVPKLVGHRAVLLRDGWAIGTFEDFSNELKIAFERLLRDRIQASKPLIDRTIRSTLSEIQEELKKVIHSMSKGPSKTDLEEYRLFRRQDLFPQCILDLYNEVMEKGHIGHNERFQLGLFLKSLGMSIEEQLRFWYNNAVDNVGLTFEQFSRGKAGYIIRHMYGLEGGETDYSPPQCSTIQDSYYCTFLHQSVSVIDEHLREEFPNPSRRIEERIRDIERKVVDKKPSEACARMFSLRYNAPCKPIIHPISYTIYAARVKKIIKRSKEEDEEPANKQKNKGGEGE